MTQTLERLESEGEQPPRRPRPIWITVAVAVTLVVSTAVAFTFARDSNRSNSTTTQQLAAMRQACAEWQSGFSGAASPPSEWCTSMIGWMTDHAHAGATPAAAMWANPTAMRTTCARAMSEIPGVAPSGSDVSQWCDQMVAWMTRYAGQWGSWHDWMMRGPIMGGAATACAVPNLPGAVVRVTLMSMAGPMMDGSMMGGGTMRLFANPATVPSGTISLVVTNVSGINHELVVLPLDANQQVGRRSIGSEGTVAETASLGEASKSCGGGAGDGIAAGSTGWLSLDLAPGRYELICNLPGHYAAGMHTLLTVS